MQITQSSQPWCKVRRPLSIGLAFWGLQVHTSALVACRSACEWIGFYLVFLPFQLLLTVATLLDAASSATTPDWVPLIGGKCAKVELLTDSLPRVDGLWLTNAATPTLQDLSLIVALLSHHFYCVTNFPSRLRGFYRIYAQRPLRHHEGALLLYAWPELPLPLLIALLSRSKGSSRAFQRCHLLGHRRHRWLCCKSLDSTDRSGAFSAHKHVRQSVLSSPRL